VRGWVRKKKKTAEKPEEAKFELFGVAHAIENFYSIPIQYTQMKKWKKKKKNKNFLYSNG